MSKFEITVPGTQFKLKSDTLYQIQPKMDASAPDGFKEHGTTKVIHPYIGNTIHAPFDSKMGVWDTGFYESSPVLRGMSNEAKKEIVSKLQEHIVRPVEEIQGEGYLSHQSSNRDLDEFGVYLTSKVIFNTADPMQRLALYLAVLGKHLAPKEHVSNPIYGRAQYVIVNQEEAVNIRQQRELDRNKAISIFFALQESDKDKLQTLFRYLDVSSTQTTELAQLNSIFNRWIDDKTSGYQNSEIFIRTYKKFEGEKGKDELYTFKMLNELYKKDKIAVQRGDVILDGEVIGSSIKQAAENAVNKKELLKKITETYQNLQELV